MVTRLLAPATARCAAFVERRLMVPPPGFATALVILTLFAVAPLLSLTLSPPITAQSLPAHRLLVMFTVLPIPPKAINAPVMSTRELPETLRIAPFDRVRVEPLDRLIRLPPTRSQLPPSDPPATFTRAPLTTSNLLAFSWIKSPTAVRRDI